MCDPRKAAGNDELRRQIATTGPSLNRVYAGQWWRLSLDTRNESAYGALAAKDAYQYAIRVVANVAWQTKLAREAPDGRSKSDALHPAAHPNFRCDVAV
jgi:hypothetical protein